MVFVILQIKLLLTDFFVELQLFVCFHNQTGAMETNKK